MIFKPSILNVAAGLYLVSCFGYTIFNYRQLSEGEGWGVVGMFGLFFFGLFLLLLDFIIQTIFKNKITINIIGVLVAIVGIILLFKK